MLGRYVLVGGVRNCKESSITSEQAPIRDNFCSVGHLHRAMQNFNRVVFEYHDVLISDSFMEFNELLLEFWP